MQHVDHPAHYGGEDNPQEAIKVIEGLGLGWGFTVGNALKYLLRAGRKTRSPVADLLKAMWYLRRAVWLAESNTDALSDVAYRADPASYRKEAPVVLLVPTSGSVRVLTGLASGSFIHGLHLGQAGAEPVWVEPRGGTWLGSLEPIGLGLRDTPFTLEVILLREHPKLTAAELDHEHVESVP